MKIQLLTFPGCPNAEPARAALREALSQEHLTESIEEIDVTRDDAPPWTRGWGSPTILIDGRDITGEAAADGEVSCRLYQGGAPSMQQVRAALLAVQGASARSHCGDLIRGRLAWLLWGIPAISFVIGIGASAARAWLWIPALLVAGGACLLNASRCGRLHCFLTGPLFLLGAIATALDASGLVAIDWRWVLGALVTGTVVASALEWGRGTYTGWPDRRGSSLPAIGAIIAAIAASACCLVPAVLAIVGISGAGAASTLAPYRPYSLSLTAVTLAAGFWFAYRPTRVDQCGCGTPRSRRGTRMALWIATVFVVGIGGYPLMFNASATVPGAMRGIAEVRLHVTGMDCKACTKVLVKRLSQVPGVATVDVDYNTEQALVTYDGKGEILKDLIDAVEDVGYDASVVR